MAAKERFDASVDSITCDRLNATALLNSANRDTYGNRVVTRMIRRPDFFEIASKAEHREATEYQRIIRLESEDAKVLKKAAYEITVEPNVLVRHLLVEAMAEFDDESNYLDKMLTILEEYRFEQTIRELSVGTYDGPKEWPPRLK
jgi:hypothetical protein